MRPPRVKAMTAPIASCKTVSAQVTIVACFKMHHGQFPPTLNAGKRGFRGLSQSRDHHKLFFPLYKHHTSEEMILAVLEYIVGFAGVVVLSVLCLHHGRHISSQVCSFRVRDNLSNLDVVRR